MDATRTNGLDAGFTKWRWVVALGLVLPAVAYAMSPVDVLASLGSLTQHGSAPLVSLAGAAVLAVGTLKVHSLRQLALPLSWREPVADEFDVRDGALRNVLKTILTMALLCTVPVQASVVASCMAWQGALHVLGFGGGFANGVPIGQKASFPPVKFVYGKMDQFFQWLAQHIMKDKRNWGFLFYMLLLSTWTPALFVTFAYYHMSQPAATATFSFSMCYCYHVLRMGPYFKFFAHAAMLIHKEGHANKMTGLFKKPYSTVLNHVMEWWIAFFYGHVPENYRVGHVEVHHGEGNGFGDCTTTLHVDRASGYAFFRYLGDFAEFWSGLAVVEYFNQKMNNGKHRVSKQKDVVDRRRQMEGMGAYYGFILLVGIVVDPMFAFMYLFMPHLETINYLSAINYTWHAFADPDDVDNEFVKSITILEGHYNLFNEDFHVEHHLRPGGHWSGSEDTYKARNEEYKENKATIFRDTMEFELFFLVVLKQLDVLAEKFVDLSGKMTHEEKKTELVRRMKAVPAAVEAKRRED